MLSDVGRRVNYGVMLQAFYWDCPQAENCEHQWWGFIKSKLPLISQAGFTALWFHPANAGPMEVRFADDYLYIMQRSGGGDRTGLVLVLNNRGTWNGRWVQ